MDAQIDQIIQSQSSPDAKVGQFVELIKGIPRQTSNSRQFAQFLEKTANIAYNRNITKPVIDAFIDHVIESDDVEFKVQVLDDALTVLVPAIVTYEEEEMKAREHLANLLIQTEEYQRAARILQDGLSSTDRQKLTDDIRFTTYVQVVRCYLEADQPELAEAPLSRAQHAQPYVTKMDPEVSLQFKLCQARIFDSNRKFLMASNKYHLISQEKSIAEEERMMCLSQAIVCAVLSPAGPLRGQALRRLYNDERSKQLKQWGILEKVYLDRLLLPGEDIAEFENDLQPHQKALTSDGTTVLTKAIIEHNVMSVSKIYNNIGVTELGKFLGLDQERAEQYAAKMIMQNRLSGKIDQVSGLIHFKSQLDSDNNSDDYDYADGNVNGSGIILLKQMDGNIQDMCNNLEEVVTALHKTHPEFVQSRLLSSQ